MTFATSPAKSKIVRDLIDMIKVTGRRILQADVGIQFLLSVGKVLAAGYCIPRNSCLPKHLPIIDSRDISKKSANRQLYNRYQTYIHPLL